MIFHLTFKREFGILEEKGNFWKSMLPCLSRAKYPKVRGAGDVGVPVSVRASRKWSVFMKVGLLVWIAMAHNCLARSSFQ